MKRKLTEMITRSLAFVLSLGIASGAWAAYVWDSQTAEGYWGTSFATDGGQYADNVIGAPSSVTVKFNGVPSANTVAAWFYAQNSGTINFLADDAAYGFRVNGEARFGTAAGATDATMSKGIYEVVGWTRVAFCSTASLSVANSTFNAYGDIIIGSDENSTGAVGTLNINDGGEVACQGEDSSARWVKFADSATSSGTLNINAGGTLAIWHMQKGAGSATVNFNGGTLKTLGNTGNCEYIMGNCENAEAPYQFSSTGPTVNIGAKGGIFDSNGLDTKVGVAVTGVGTITKKGTGTLTFTGDMSGFIGKVAVANGAGSVTLPASAEHARAGDYTSVVTNQDGTFTFSYDANAGAATTATATLLSLDFEDDSYAEDASGWVGKTIEGQIINSPKNDVAGAGTSQGTRANGSKYLHLTLDKNASRGVVYVLPTSCSTASEFSLEFDWFSAAGVIYNNAGNNSGFALYDTAGKEIVGVEVPCAGNNNLFDSTVYAGAKEIALGSIKAKRMADPTTETELWHHILITGNASDSSMKLTITDGNGTKKISNVSLGGFVNVAQIYVCLGTKGSYGSVRGGIDNVVFSIPAVAAVDGTPYATFASAVAAATSSSTITLYSDVELTSSVTLPYGATLVLNGYALYTTDENVAVTFNDGVHYLGSTTAGGYKTFTEAITVADTTYVWTGNAGDNLWATPGNWRVGDASLQSAPSITDTVLFDSNASIEFNGVDANAYDIIIHGNVQLGAGTINLRHSVWGSGMLRLAGTTVLNSQENDSNNAYNTVTINCPVEFVAETESVLGINTTSRCNAMTFTVSGNISGSGNFQTRIGDCRYVNKAHFIFSGTNSSFSGTADLVPTGRSGQQGGYVSFSKPEAAFSNANASTRLMDRAVNDLGNRLHNGGSYYDGTVFSMAGEYSFGALSAALQSGALVSGVVLSVGNANETSAISGTLGGGGRTLKKVGAMSTLNLTLTESVGAVEAEAGTLNLKGTFAPASLTITGADATVTVEEGNEAELVLADSLKDGYKIVSTAGEGFTTYKAGANCTITWKVEGLDDEVVSSAVGAVVSHANAVRNGYVFDRWEPAVVSPATGDATYTAIWKTADVTVAKPVVAYGADYTRATVTAAVEVKTPGDVTYELTVTKGATTATYTGTVSGGTVTFADVAVPREAADIYADITYTVTPKAGTAALTSEATTEAPTTKSEWEFSSRVNGDAVANVGGSWTTGAPTVAENKKLAINDATFTATAKSADDIVVITMEDVIFGDTNDAEITGAQAGIRIGESGEFEVLSATGWIETEIPANGEEAYDVVLTINYATKKYSVKIGTGTFANILLAGSETGVKTIEFNGAGSLASLVGEAYDGNMVVDTDGNKYATVDAAIAALKAGTATAPLKMLHDGTAPAGWTIDENGVLTKASIEVESEADKTLVAVPQGCTSIDTLIDLSNRYADDQIQAYDSKTGKFNTWQLSSEKVWTGVGRQDQDDAQPVFPTEADKVLKAGQAVWVLRMTKESKAAPIRLNASYADAPATVALETGWNLVAPTVDVEDLNSLNIVAAATDRIVVPSANGGAPAELKYKNGEWGYNTAEKDESGRWVLKFETKGITIPAGTGFWYVSDSDKNISL